MNPFNSNKSIEIIFEHQIISHTCYCIKMVIYCFIFS